MKGGGEDLMEDIIIHPCRKAQLLNLSVDTLCPMEATSPDFTTREYKAESIPNAYYSWQF